VVGYGYSRLATTGWDCPRIARAWVDLMKRLGYTRYVAQSVDWGALITEQMGVLAPPATAGIHINLPSAVPAEILKALGSGAGVPAGLWADERAAFQPARPYFFTHGLSYAQQMANPPQTLYAIAESPVQLAAWFLDHDLPGNQLIARAFDGQREGLTRDDALDNVTFTWLTNTAISSSRLYRENKLPFFLPMGVEIPVAVSAFHDELYQAPRNLMQRAYPKLIHYNKMEKGSHSAAWEPALFCEEVRVGVRSLRK
jgi:pimeloyl-ACP methyl ester carboxylesterase